MEYYTLTKKTKMVIIVNYKIKSAIGVCLILNFNQCPCEGNYLDKLIQPAILTILAEEDLYGYKIVQRIAEMPMFNGYKPDGTGVYRFLKSMEKRGLVVSTWDVSDKGPAKRIYQLTRVGEKCLSRWIKTLEDYRRNIGMLLSEAQKVSAKTKERFIKYE